MPLCVLVPHKPCFNSDDPQIRVNPSRNVGQYPWAALWLTWAHFPLAQSLRNQAGRTCQEWFVLLKTLIFSIFAEGILKMLLLGPLKAAVL